MLTAGWTDGNSFIPLGFNLQSSANKKNRYNEMKQNLNKNSNGYKRREKANTKFLRSICYSIHGFHIQR